MATGSILPFWFSVILFLIFIVVIQFTVHFVADIFTDEDEYIRYRRYAQQSTCTSRAASFRSYPFSGDVHWCSSIQSFDCICFRTFPRSSERIKDMFFDIHPRSYRSSKRDIIEDTYHYRHIRQCKYMAWGCCNQQISFDAYLCLRFGYLWLRFS